ncbi:MAG: alginate lyase family protein [Anaeroplasmataceae bacterium]|nr:alginate lyase family protein [Anaeroplasmataceae bacterium]
MRLNNYFDEIVNNIYLFQADDLEQLKALLTKEDLENLDQLLEEAIQFGIHSVVEKKHLAPSKNPHDYMSCSIYHWPNPNTPDGLPYVERDGVDNPEAIHGDKESLRTLAYITYLSSILLYITGNEKYLDIILKFNEFWFINPETKMNPNLRYAQCIPGVNDGEPGGIIDYAASYGYALHMLTLLNKRHLLPDEFYLKMKAWHQEFLSWLFTSEQGIIEGKRLNNQGSLYDLLIVNIKEFLNEEESIKQSYYEKLLDRLAYQIDEEGKMPLELVRTKTKSYTTMGLKMLLESAYLLQGFGYSFKDNQDLKRAFNYVLPHYLNQTWEHMQIKEFDSYRGYYILYLFSKIINAEVHITFEEMPMHWGYILLKKLLKGERKYGKN